jgi:hypothetical protein
MRMGNGLILNFNMYLAILIFITIILRHPKSKNVFEKTYFSGCFCEIQGGASVGRDKVPNDFVLTV